jgi:hypothetical protein
MVAFPPHLQLAFPVTFELALSAHTYGLRFRRPITLTFFVSYAVSSLSDSLAGGLALRMPFAFDYFRVVASLQYAYGLHSTFGFRLQFFDLVVDFAASVPILSSHAGRTFMVIIVTLRVPSPALRLISDAISHQFSALRTHADPV